MIPSGILPLERQLGGLVPARIHVLAGGVGTGKSTAALQFLAAGVAAGETVALLTRDTPAELAAHAAYLGFDIERAVAERQLTVLRFGRRFAHRLMGGVSTAAVVDELRREWAVPRRPARLVVDPASPFLADGRPAGAGLSALVEFIEQMRATALVTWPGPVAGGEDRRLDPLVESAAVVATLSRRRDGGFAMRIDRARLTGVPRWKIPFDIVPGEGIVSEPAGGDDSRPPERLSPAEAVGS